MLDNLPFFKQIPGASWRPWAAKLFLRDTPADGYYVLYEISTGGQFAHPAYRKIVVDNIDEHSWYLPQPFQDVANGQ